ncbi:hypothetical protein [Anaerococcus hydrogenalis]|uniref:Uncharacterized protein n=1 Tax=Anaerococcus hydrogenalis TaxID=33029 RepID=A0A2N6UH02_9FIRM|nr:hypothetical protein [Anaerococcus hydrogenalis]MDK7695585.1 hypothetical protein [Anaerococcus hydrogenalis]MDK7697344.1 hypothetical protein [Anaerococcus hydrogenalis]MDK7708676.1 hypothetical protein [Anaerococcus hydrogenalis]PMC80888.1 hypothetical protein CJ192_07900 [Anaerococcus hydrogenalis]
MKKSNKILALGLGLSLIFAPATSLVSNNINLVYAEESQEKQEKEVSPEEFVAYANEFVDSDEFKALDEKDQKTYKELIKDLTAENLGQDEIDEINKTIDDIKFSYIKDKYDKLKQELDGLKADNLSDDLKEKIKSYEDSYQTYDKYFEAVDKIENTIKSIEIYNKDLKSHKDVLKKAIKAIEDNKNFKIDLNNEKAVLENKNAKLDEVDNAIKNLNIKVNAYNKKVEEEKNRLSNMAKLEEKMDGEKSTKESTNYKKASKAIRQDFDKKIQAVKDAYNKLDKKEKVENVDQIISNYNSAFDKLDGDKNLEAYNKLFTYYNENKEKLSKEDQKKYEDLIEKLDKSEDFGMDKINELKSQIEKAIKDDEDSATLKKVGAKKIGVQKSSGPKVKRSRSFVRTGVKSVGIVLIVLVVAGLAYFFVAKKDKK